MKKLIVLSALILSTLAMMSFYNKPSEQPKYEYMSIHVPVSVGKPEVIISRAAKQIEVIQYKKADFDLSTELARIQSFEDEGWELFQIVNQNSVEMNVLIIMRKLR